MTSKKEKLRLIFYFQNGPRSAVMLQEDPYHTDLELQSWISNVTLKMLQFYGRKEGTDYSYPSFLFHFHTYVFITP